MKRTLLAGAGLLLAAHLWAADPHSVQGIVIQVNPAHQSIVVSCDAIPGYMDAMVMPFTVPGATVRFQMVEGKDQAYAENLKVVEVTNHEAEPTEAGRLTFLHNVMDPAAASKVVKVGELVPDFTLTDQAGEATRLSQFRGKVIALTFAYSRCPNPNYCFRLSNNLSNLERRFHAQAGSSLILITIVIDPDEDQGKALARYADTWKADPKAWRFLTGNLDDVRNAAQLFGMGFWDDDGFLTHAFHTVVIDRQGKLAANIEGNQFTAQQLGDLVETVMQRPEHASASSTRPVMQ